MLLYAISTLHHALPAGRSKLWFNRLDHAAIYVLIAGSYTPFTLGVLRAGLVVVNTNPQYTPHEFEHQLNDSGAKAIVVFENFAGRLAKVVGSTSVRTVITAQMGGLLPPVQRWLTNAVVKHVRRLVPPGRWPVPRH